MTTRRPARVHLIAAHGDALGDLGAAVFYGVAELIAVIAPHARLLRADMAPEATVARRRELLAAVSGVLELRQESLVAASMVRGDVAFLEALVRAGVLSFAAIDTIIVSGRN